MKSARSLRFPLLIALPVLAALVAGGIFLVLPDPEPPPQPNVEPEPAPLDNTGDDGVATDPLDPGPDVIPPDRYPNSPAIAEAMTTEAFAGLELIRARLELKFKYADYTHDPAWKVAGIIRRPERLAGEFFNADDFSLRFEDEAVPVVQIQVAISKTTSLPDGPISLQVDLKTGESEPAGFILARDSRGGVLLQDEHYAVATRLLMQLASAWQEQTRVPEEFREDYKTDMEHYLQWYIGEFSTDDLVNAAETTSGVEFSLRTFHRHKLAWPAVITLSADGRSGTISSVPADTWMPVPNDRAEVIQDLQWALPYAFENWFSPEEGEGPPDSAPAVSNLLDGFELRQTVSCFGDWTLKLGETEHTLTLNSSYGRPLPFGPLTYAYDVGTGKGRFLDP